MVDQEKGTGRIVLGLFLCVVASLGFMKPSADVGFASLTPTDILFPILFICWLVGLATGSCRFKWQSEFWAFVIYLLVLAVSALFSVNPGASVIKLAGVTYLLLLAVLSASIVTSRDRLRLSMLAWLAGSAFPIAAGLMGILLFYTAPENPWLGELTYHYGAVPVGNYPRLSSTFISASMYCNYLTVSLMCALLSARMNWISTRWTVVIISALTVCAVGTVSMALGGFVLAAGLWFWISSSNESTRRLSLSLSAAVGLAFLATTPFALSLRPGSSIFERLLPSSRLLVWQDALNTFLSNPLTGSGPGTPVANVVFQNYDGTWSLLTDAHNLFLNVAAQSGILGLFAIALIIVVTLRGTITSSSRSEDGDQLVFGLTIAFVAAFLYDGLTGSFEDARHLWILIGIVLAAKRLRTAPVDQLP